MSNLNNLEDGYDEIDEDDDSNPAKKKNRTKKDLNQNHIDGKVKN